jgi:TolA-binding protein
MSTIQVRCSRQVHQKLKEISDREGVSLAHALEILTEGAGAGDDPVLAVGEEPERLEQLEELRLKHLETQFQELQGDVTTLLGRLEMLVGLVEELHAAHSGHQHGMGCSGCREQVEQENPGDGEQHQHGDDCPECAEQQSHGEYRGIQRTAIFYESKVPGAKEAREHAWIGEQTVNIVDNRRPETVDTRTLSDLDFALVLKGLMMEAEEHPYDPELKAKLVELMEEAGERGIGR